MPLRSQETAVFGRDDEGESEGVGRGAGGGRCSEDPPDVEVSVLYRYYEQTAFIDIIGYY